MSPEEQRIAIAEACGWTMPKYSKSFGDPDDYVARIEPDGSWIECPLPDYLNDLNAMHEAINATFIGDPRNDINVRDRWQVFIWELLRIVSPRSRPNWSDCYTYDRQWVIAILQATAAQLAEAFLRTLGKWESTQ